MESSIFLLLLVVVGGPLTAGIWLIARAISAREHIEKLNRRVDDLELEIIRLKQGTPAKPKTLEDKVAGFTAATLPPRKKETGPATPPPIPVRERPAPMDPAVAELLAAPMAIPAPQKAEVPVAEPVASTTPADPTPVIDTASLETPITAPPIIPPLPEMPPVIPPIAAAPEPVLASARAQTPASEPPVPEKSSFEMRLGTFWLVRVGIVLLLAGLAFFANYAYHNIVGKLNAWEKTSLLYAASGLLLGAGAWWQRRNVKESLKNYGQVLFAGGLAAVYFTTYAGYHIPPLQIIHSVLLDGTLLLAWAGVIAWIADRRKSEVMALFAVCLAFFTSVITRVGEFTLYSNLILTIAAVVFLVRNRWAALSFVSLVTSYVGYAFWRFLHEDGWHWATPDETLRLGAGFLAAYWVVFTAAAFLSKNSRLSGHSRATFVTLNNGAYFALFLLTMLQVHTGGFWKFSLAYGSVLVAMALLAGKFLREEPLTRNAYLTQGLTLVTLGFIAKFAGLQLALVLGAESVVLYVLATQRNSLVLKVFGYAAALLGTGWCVTNLPPFEARGLGTAVGLGAMLAFNGFWAFRQETRTQPKPHRGEVSAFAVLAFMCWAAATWYNTAAPHLPVALVAAAASAVFYNLIGGHKIATPKFLAGAAAAGAVAWCLANLGHFETKGLWVGIATGALMVLNAVRAHRASLDQAQPLRAEPAAFTLLAFAPWLAVTWCNTTPEHLPLALAAEAVAVTFSIYLLRVRELPLLGQGFLILAQAAWLYHFFTATPPWWNPLLIIGVTTGLSHWWQHQKVLAVSRTAFHAYAAVFALTAVAVALVWLHPLVSAPAWLVLTSGLAVAVTGYGLVTRAWALAIGGQVFLAVSVWGFLSQFLGDQAEWYFPLAPMIVLLALSLATLAWFARADNAGGSARAPLLQVALIYRWLALTMSLPWVWQYVPERQRVWVFMLAAATVFALAVWRGAREALIAAGVYAVASLTLLWARDGAVMEIYWANLASLLAPLVMQQLLRRLPAKLPLTESVHGAVVIVAGLSLWRFLSCWTQLAGGGFMVTMAWAGFALAMFTAGILLHERFFRWFGLGVLAAAIGRVVLVDVWNEQTIYRVLTFMALGAALLVVGFIYNKYQETIRKWL